MAITFAVDDVPAADGLRAMFSLADRVGPHLALGASSHSLIDAPEVHPLLSAVHVAFAEEAPCQGRETGGAAGQGGRDHVEPRSRRRGSLKPIRHTSDRRGHDTHVAVRSVRTPADASQLLADLGASPWLIRHHELVVEAMHVLVARVRDELGVAFDRELALLGAALHDAGKVVHPQEMTGPGHQHELAGEKLVISHGVPGNVARFCVTHAAWNDDSREIEDLLVALADKLWKGKREEQLERRVVGLVARLTNKELWEVFDAFDSICEEIAAGGSDRLERSQV
jgi:hypothetical protein